VEGKRINLRVFRRNFYPLNRTYQGQEYTIYSDTGRQREINYNHSEDYGLDNPFNRIRLYRLARAMNCLECNQLDDGSMECKVVLCKTQELAEPDNENTIWTPFDPKRLKPLEDRVKEAEQKIKWRNQWNPDTIS
jgi:hypothetical protein